MSKRKEIILESIEECREYLRHGRCVPAYTAIVSLFMEGDEYWKNAELWTEMAPVFSCFLSKRKIDLHGPGLKTVYDMLENSGIKDFDVFYNFALVLDVLSQSEYARNAMKQALEIRPNDFDALLYYGKMITLIKDWELSLHTLKKAVEIRPTDPRPRMEQISVLFCLHRFREAVGAYQKGIELGADPETFYTIDNKRVKEAEELVRGIDEQSKILEQNPNDANALFLSGVNHYKLTEYAEAESYLRRFLAIEPDNVDALTVLGITLHELKRDTEALKSFKRVHELVPEEAYSWGNMGEIHYHLFDYENAVNFFEKSLDIDSENIEVWTFLRLSLQKLARYEEAYSILGKSHQVSWARDLNFWLVDRHEDLEKLNEELNKLETESTRTKEQQERLELLQRIIDDDKFLSTQIRELWSRLTKKPNDVVIWNDIGVLFFYLDDISQMKEAFNKVLELNPSDTSALYNLAVYSTLRAIKSQASEFIDQILAIDSTDEKAKQFMHEHKGHEFRVSEDLRKKFNKRGYIIAEKSVWTLL